MTPCALGSPAEISLSSLAWDLLASARAGASAGTTATLI